MDCSSSAERAWPSAMVSERCPGSFIWCRIHRMLPRCLSYWSRAHTPKLRLCRGSTRAKSNDRRVAKQGTPQNYGSFCRRCCLVLFSRLRVQFVGHFLQGLCGWPKHAENLWFLLFAIVAYRRALLRSLQRLIVPVASPGTSKSNAGMAGTLWGAFFCGRVDIWGCPDTSRLFVARACLEHSGHNVSPR